MPGGASFLADAARVRIFNRCLRSAHHPVNSILPGDASFDSQPNAWEAAYLRFETPAREVDRFHQRLLRLGARHWPRDAQIVELFCGRGSGLRTLSALGFANVEGVDFSPHLAAWHDGPGHVHVADCRRLPFPDSSRDILIVHGGLHHLPRLPEDLDQTLAEASRVLRPHGRFVCVEPWITPFLRCVHAVCDVPLARALSERIDALAAMLEHERPTYEQWLREPERVRHALRTHFKAETESIRWGKLLFVGLKA